MRKIVFAGSASPDIARAIAQRNGYRLGKSEKTVFSNSELKMTILEKVEDVHSIVVQSIVNPTNDNLIELLFTIDALKREGATKVTLVIPYFGYARQDIQHLPGECVSINVIIKAIEALGTSKVITVDIHDEATAGVFTIPFRNISVLPFMATLIKEDMKLDPSSVMVGSPDQGGIERARMFAQALYGEKKEHDVITIEKKRTLTKVHTSKPLELFGTVKDKTVLLVDDVATSGGTLLHAAEVCYEHGAKDVVAAVVHADFALGVPKRIQKSPISRWYTTNSIESTQENLSQFSKISILDISSIISESL